MRKSMKVASGAAVVVLLATGAAYLLRDQLTPMFFKPTESKVGDVPVETKALEVVASRLDTPWSISFLPSGDMLVPERSGRIQRIGSEGKIYPISGVREIGEGGLLGVTLHPEFPENNRLYVYFTTDANGVLENQVDEYILEGDKLSRVRSLIEGIPAASNHNGGAIGFGPDGKLYVTTGDAAQETLAQDRNSLAGKILRLNDDGSVPSDNPFGNPVWSYGHRNPQGITWDDKGRLWSVEHGPSGVASGRDELNLIEKGANYGWPEITGDETRAGMRSPIAQSGDKDTWAPAGLAYYDGSLYFAGLRGQALYRAEIDGDSVSLSKYLSSTYGRIRAVTAYEGSVYVSTSNRDGRGSPAAEDDRIIRIDPSRL